MFKKTIDDNKNGAEVTYEIFSPTLKEMWEMRAARTALRLAKKRKSKSHDSSTNHGKAKVRSSTKSPVKGKYSLDSSEEIKEESFERDNSSSYDLDEMEAIDDFLVGN